MFIPAVLVAQATAFAARATGLRAQAARTATAMPGPLRQPAAHSPARRSPSFPF
jgi:hypothetical protein